MPQKPYGSGYFGLWFEDEHGLPAYRYTCDQTRDPKAVTPVCNVWRTPTDHSHQVGNDRLVAVASNYGYVQVRQDEGGPKFLNDYDPQAGKYAGGFGYLTDGQTLLSTYYPGGGEQFERVFGAGYLRKTVTGGGYCLDQVIFAPFGDDPLLVSQVTVANQRNHAMDLRWVEYWDCQMYQFSDRGWIYATIRRKPALAARQRRAFASRFAHRFAVIGDCLGLMEDKRFLGWRPSERLRWGMAQALLETAGRGVTGGRVKAAVKEASLEDFVPPPTFLVSLDAPVDGLATSSRLFFGQGGLERPDGMRQPLPGDLSSNGPDRAMFLERRFSLSPGESRTLTFAYGYLPQGFTLDELLARYRDDLPGLWSRSSAAWKAGRIQLEIPGEPWVDRELAWHNYYLRSDLTYDSFFQEHILSQGHVYQYVIGFQGAARDPLQHALPFVFSQPEIVRQVLRYTLKEVKPDGEIPYGITGHGMLLPAQFRPSDQELWLLWLASEYVLANRDTAFLDEQIQTFPVYGPKAGKARVADMLWRCYRHLVDVAGFGEHGLLRLSNGDWNDMVVIGHVPPGQHRIVIRKAESVLNSAMAAYVLDHYARMLTCTGQVNMAADAHRQAESQRQAVGAQWTGQWFRRAWLTPKIGWVGDEQIWLEPQPWAIISRAAAPDQVKQLVQSIDEAVRRPSPIGARLLGQGVPKMQELMGSGSNGGVWPSINGTLVWALARVDSVMAWDEWVKNSLAAHAEAYPEVWYGIWSGPDTYNSTLSRHPGQTVFDERFIAGEPPKDWFNMGVNWTDFPVMNMHPHAWPLYDIPKLLDVEFTPQGVEFTPSLPQPEYRFGSPLLGLEKSVGGYSGWYSPQTAGIWQVTLHLPEGEGNRFTALEVNGRSQPITRTGAGALQWEGESQPGKPFVWSLR
jgi:hypothetical protein